MSGFRHRAQDGFRTRCGRWEILFPNLTWRRHIVEGCCGGIKNGPDRHVGIGVANWALVDDNRDAHPPEAKGDQYWAVDTYRWLPGHAVLVHEVQARMGEKIVNSLEIYTASDAGIVSRNFDSTGAVSDYRAEMADGVWRVEGQTERFVSTSMAANTIKGLWQLKVDDDWLDWMTVHLERVA